MDITRREFAAALTGVAGAATRRRGARRSPANDPCHLPAPIRALTPKIDGIVPITDDERRARIARAQALMVAQGIGAIVIEPGTTMHYFSAVDWHSSERTFAMVIPGTGPPAWVCPAFEEARARELIRFGDDIRVWQEDESPFARIAGILKDRDAASGKVGLEEEVRFFVMDGLRRAAPSADLVSATPVTAGCRMI